VCGKNRIKIKFTEISLDDYSRAVTPAEAISLGADYLVIGRALTLTNEPRAATT